MKARRLLLMPLMALMVMLLAGSTTSCRHRVDMTAIAIQDSIRHYWPLLQGQNLNLQFRIKNIGHSPLVLTDIQPSCGCIHSKDNPSMIPPGKEAILQFTFTSEKNIGLVRHYIRLFGNIVPNGRAEMVFDVNVVVPSTANRDYEEVHHESVARRASIERLVDGTESEKGYYTDPMTGSRDHKRYEWRDGPKGRRGN